MEMKERKINRGLDIALKVLRWLYLIIYVLISIYIIWVAIDEITTKMQNPEASFVGLGFALVLLIFGSIAFGAATIIAIAMLVLSLINKNALKRKLNIISSSIMIVVPYLTELIFYLVFAVYFG